MPIAKERKRKGAGLSAKTTIKLSRATRELIDRCEKLLAEMPEPQRSNIRFVTALTGGAVPAPGAKMPAGEVVHYALAVLHANLDPEARALRDAAELAYQDYVRRLKDGHKSSDGDPEDPNEIRSMG